MRTDSDSTGKALMEKENMGNRSEEVIMEGCAPPPMGNLTQYPPQVSVLVCQALMSHVSSTFLGEKTPKVPPSSRMATPISASKASL